MKSVSAVALYLESCFAHARKLGIFGTTKMSLIFYDLKSEDGSSEAQSP